MDYIFYHIADKWQETSASLPLLYACVKQKVHFLLTSVYYI